MIGTAGKAILHVKLAAFRNVMPFAAGKVERRAGGVPAEGPAAQGSRISSRKKAAGSEVSIGMDSISPVS